MIRICFDCSPLPYIRVHYTCESLPLHLLPVPKPAHVEWISLFRVDSVVINVHHKRIGYSGLVECFTFLECNVELGLRFRLEVWHIARVQEIGNWAEGLEGLENSRGLGEAHRLWRDKDTGLSAENRRRG